MREGRKEVWVDLSAILDQSAILRQKCNSRKSLARPLRSPQDKVVYQRNLTSARRRHDFSVSVALSH